MKLNKKVMGLLVAGLLSVPMFGCGNNEVEQQLPQTQIEEQQPQEQEPQQEQQKPVDEDLNDEYQAKIDERQFQNDKEQAKQVIDQVMAEHFPDIEYRIIEENNLIGIVINIPDNDVALTSIDKWNELVGILVDYDIMIQQFLQQCGLNVQTVTMAGNIQRDEPYLMIVNGEVIVDVFNGINKLN